MLRELCDQMDGMEDLVYPHPVCHCGRAAPERARGRGSSSAGYNEAVDEYKTDMTDGKGIIARVEAAERERTGIKSLKVGYNRVFGYYIEVTNTYSGSGARRTTYASRPSTNCERYITQELKELETPGAWRARSGLVQLEYDLFVELRGIVAAQLYRIQRTAAAVAMLDAVCSLAQRLRYDNRYVPAGRDRRMAASLIQNGRHPVVEQLLGEPVCAQRHPAGQRRQPLLISSPAPIWPGNLPTCARWR